MTVSCINTARCLDHVERVAGRDVCIVLAPVPPFPTHLFLHPSLLPLLIHHFVLLQLHLSFTPGLKPTSFTNPFPRSFTSSSRTASTQFCLHRFLLSYSVFDFIFFLIFRSWTVRYIKLAISSAFERTLIYRIISYRIT